MEFGGVSLQVPPPAQEYMPMKGAPWSSFTYKPCEYMPQRNKTQPEPCVEEYSGSRTHASQVELVTRSPTPDAVPRPLMPSNQIEPSCAEAEREMMAAVAALRMELNMCLGFPRF
jgi:hypothetical protein